MFQSFLLGLRIFLYIWAMYEKLKKLVKSIIPKGLLKRHEGALRAIVAKQYKGVSQECNVCGYKLSQFIKLDNGDSLCPKCGCLPRTRRLLKLIQAEIDVAEKAVLHFSPPKSLMEVLESGVCKEYVTTDFEGEFDAAKNLDITSMDEAEARYDIIICYHVLEHIEADTKAMSELYRILKSGGVCFIQTPFKVGSIYEDALITSEADRLLHFGQEDHVRIYSVLGLEERLKSVGFDVEVRKFKAEPINYHGLNSRETVLIASKKGSFYTNMTMKYSK